MPLMTTFRPMSPAWTFTFISVVQGNEAKHDRKILKAKIQTGFIPCQSAHTGETSVL